MFHHIRLYLRCHACLLLFLVILPKSLCQLSSSSKPEASWSRWSHWSPCSQSCGQGVQTRTRRCTYTSRGSSYSGKSYSPFCLGAYQDVKICNIRACAGKETSYRDEQCSKYNQVKYRGRYFRWKPHIRKNHECKLICQPVGFRIYLKITDAVPDGTQCRPDGICLAGKCKKVGCDGIVGSDKRKDKCGVCGGDNSSCHIVSGIFTRTGLTYGYNKVTTIPVGACNINVTESLPSTNYLALKIHNGKYVINGEYSVDFEDDFKAAGTTFEYRRPPPGHQREEREHILADGPLTEKVDVMLLKQHRNRGVMYSYTIPVNLKDAVVQKDDSRRYTIDKNTDEDEGSKTTSPPRGKHGKTLQGRSRLPFPLDHRQLGARRGRLYAHSRRTTRYQPQGWQQGYNWQGQPPRSQSRRANPYYLTPGTQESRGGAPHPQYTRRFPSRDAIPLYQPDHNAIHRPLVPASGAAYAWAINGFTQCTRTCGGGTQNTIIMCIRPDNRAVVTDDNCANLLKPEVQSVRCNTRACPPAWETGGWGDCSTTCDEGIQQRTVGCQQRVSEAVTIRSNRCDPQQQPPATQPCNTDKPCNRWQIGNWSRCSTECGKGQKTREVICINYDNQTVPENKCAGPKPAPAEYCDMGSCAKTWFFSAWSEQCSAECGDGMLTRKVTCVGERCNPYSRPRSQQRCKNDLPCGGRWFIGPWGECSVSCGKGVRRRDIACIKNHVHADVMQVVPEHNCQHTEKPEDEEPCSAPACKPEWYMTEWTDCSRSCNTGYQTREIKCLDERQQFSTTCSAGDRPSTKRSCNTNSCPRRRSTEHRCADQHKQCVYIAQARLCRYNYYRQLCCISCRQLAQNSRH